MNYKIETIQLNAQSALVIKGMVRVEEIGKTIEGIIGRIGAYLSKNGTEPSGAPFTRTFSHKDGVIEFETGFPVSKNIKGEGDIIAIELPKGLMATTEHIGSQEGSEKAYEALHIWMKQNKKSEAGAPWEVYTSESNMRVYYPIH